MAWKRFPHYWPFVRGINHKWIPFKTELVVFFVGLNKLLNKQPSCRWFEPHDFTVMGNTLLVALQHEQSGSSNVNHSTLYWSFIALVTNHYRDVIMGAMASQITSLMIVYSTVYSGADKHQSSASLAFVRGIHRWPVNSPHKWPVTRKMFPFDDVIMWPIFVTESFHIHWNHLYYMVYMQPILIKMRELYTYRTLYCFSLCLHMPSYSTYSTASHQETRYWIPEYEDMVFALLPLIKPHFVQNGRRNMAVLRDLTHWDRDKITTIFQTTFSNVFSWIKMYEFRLRFHWSLFLRVQSTIFRHWFR